MSSSNVDVKTVEKLRKASKTGEAYFAVAVYKSDVYCYRQPCKSYSESLQIANTRSMSIISTVASATTVGLSNLFKKNSNFAKLTWLTKLSI